MLKTYIFLFQLLLVIITVNGAPPANEKPLQLYKQTVYTAGDGLPQNSVYPITQAPDGYIWIATNAGTARFDGVEFDMFTRANTPSMVSDITEILLVDRNGTLWVGTSQGGIMRYKNGAFDKIYSTADGLLSNDVKAIRESENNPGSTTLWSPPSTRNPTAPSGPVPGTAA